MRLTKLFRRRHRSRRRGMCSRVQERAVCWFTANNLWRLKMMKNWALLGLVAVAATAVLWVEPAMAQASGFSKIQSILESIRDLITVRWPPFVERPGGEVKLGYGS